MRYLDQIENKYSLSIKKKQLLVELDYTIFEVFKRFQFGSTKRGKIKLLHEVATENKEPKLYENNYILNNIKNRNLLSNKIFAMVS
jgi:hypothetical protein